MAESKRTKRNWLERNLPEGLLVDSAWLQEHGYSTSLRSQYVANGWLEQPTRGVYRRPRGRLSWPQVVISLQMRLGYALVVGGRTALELEGFAHYLPMGRHAEIHLYGEGRPPGWLGKLPLDECFVFHNANRLFADEAVGPSLRSLVGEVQAEETARAGTVHGSLLRQSWGSWDWPLVLSTPERAILELLDELPQRETFHQVDMLMEALGNLSPRRLQRLLLDCRSIKVKRLFFWFADRHKHAWRKRIDRDAVDLGKGKRMIVRGGKLDPTYQITVPREGRIHG